MRIATDDLFLPPHDLSNGEAQDGRGPDVHEIDDLLGMISVAVASRGESDVQFVNRWIADLHGLCSAAWSAYFVRREGDCKVHSGKEFPLINEGVNIRHETCALRGAREGTSSAEIIGAIDLLRERALVVGILRHGESKASLEFSGACDSIKPKALYAHSVELVAGGKS